MTNWPKIKLLESRLGEHRGKANYRRDQLHYWQQAGRNAHYWHHKHYKEHNARAARRDLLAIERARGEIVRWQSLLTPEELEIHRLESALYKLKPKRQLYYAGGWVRPGEPFRMQRQDQGQDFEIPRYHSVIAPGRGYCIGYYYDRPFPNGFGSPYAVVHIDDGRFGGNDWYIGHCNEPIIRPEQRFSMNQPLARANNSLDAGWGWTELGHWSGGPGPMGEGERWAHLFSPIWK